MKLETGKLVLPLLIFALVSSLCAQDWTVTRILDNVSESVGQSSVKADSNGEFMIAYPKGSPGPSAGDFEIFARTSSDGASWSSPETVRDVPGTNKYCNLVFDSSDSSLVAWQRKRASGSAYDIWLARENELSPGWITEQVTNDPNDDKRVRGAVFFDDRVVLAFPRHMPAGSEGDKDIAAATFNGFTWDVDMVTSNSKGDHRCDVVIDEMDKIHLCYAGYVGSGKGQPTQADWRLYYTNNVSGDWAIPVDLSSQLSLPKKADFPEMAMDPSGKLHIVTPAGDSAGSEDREMWHVTNESGSWSAVNISDHVSPCEWSSLAIHTDGSIHVAYQVGRIFKESGNVPTKIYYAYRNAAGDWSAPEEIIDSWGDCEQPAIAINDAGRIVVSYGAKVSGAFQLIAATKMCDSCITAVSDWEIYE